MNPLNIPGVMTGRQLAGRQAAGKQGRPTATQPKQQRTPEQREFLKAVWNGLTEAANASPEGATQATFFARGPNDRASTHVSHRLGWVPHHTQLSGLAEALTAALRERTDDSIASITLERLGKGPTDYQLVARAVWANIHQFGGPPPQF